MLPQRRSQRQNSEATQLPAPIGGINAVVSMPEMRADECIFMINILPEDFGCEVRDGFREWANGWTGGAAKTVIPFEGNVDTEDRLFVANPTGIWDVTTDGTTVPAQVVTFPSSGGQAGVCHSVNYGNDAGDRFLLVTDGENGYYTWTQTTDTWTKIAQGGGGGITGVDPDLFNFVMIWKARVWFIERNTGKAWFLNQSDTFLGTVNLFNWGDQFRYGGPLVSLHNWTLDGGNGIDDYLVGLSSAGDVIVYQGVDPTSKNDFGLVGQWFVGQLPFGNRCATEYGGELYILSVQGLSPLSAVLRGSAANSDETYITNKVSPYIRVFMDDLQEDFGWHVHIHPKQSLLYINTPFNQGARQFAFTLYFGHKSWGIVGELNKSHTANWKGEVYWTDINRNKIMIQEGSVDGVYIDPILDGAPAAIDWEILGSYHPLGKPATFTRTHFLRPIFVGRGGVPAYTIKAYYDYDISRLSTPPVFGDFPTPLWGNLGSFIFSLASADTDVLVLSIQDGTVQISGVTTVEVTIGTQGLATLTWNVPNERYEGPSVGIRAYLLSEVGNGLSTVINPDIHASSVYTVTVAVLEETGPDQYGAIQPLSEIFPPDDLPATPPPTDRGSISPNVIAGTGLAITNEGSWNVNVWTGGIQTNDQPRGALGIGRTVAVGIRGRTSSKVTLVGYEVIYDQGGIL